MKTLKEKREELFNYCILNKEEMGFIFDEVEKQDKEFIKEILEEIDIHKECDYKDKDECLKEIEQIIKAKSGFEE